MRIRVSVGSLAKLNLLDTNTKSLPQTLYLLQYSEDGCLAYCKFCAQSRGVNVSKKFLSRVTWYPIELNELVEALIRRGIVFQRVCIQTVLKRGFIEEIYEIINALNRVRGYTGLSVALTPVNTVVLERLADLGVDTIGVGLDASSPRIFESLGKPYGWTRYMSFIDEVLNVFKKATIHVIIGLGETIDEYTYVIKELIGKGCSIALFPYVNPLSKKPNVEVWFYRLIQIVTYMLEKGLSYPKDLEGLIEDMVFNTDKYIDTFLTRGCSGCNRPFYTENPRGPFYNLYSYTHYVEYKERLLSELTVVKKLVEKQLFH